MPLPVPFPPIVLGFWEGKGKGKGLNNTRETGDVVDYSKNKRNFENRTVSRLLGVILEAQILSFCTKPLRTRLGCCGTALPIAYEELFYPLCRRFLDTPHPSSCGPWRSLISGQVAALRFSHTLPSKRRGLQALTSNSR